LLLSKRRIDTLQHHSQRSLFRKRSAANKVYVPAQSRFNQYILVEIKIDEQFIAKHFSVDNKTDSSNQYALSYRKLATEFFSVCQKYQLANVNFIANDRLIRVRFGEEQQVIETKQQLIFFYNPSNHTGFRSFYQPQSISKKIQLLFLATGQDTRESAANFHRITQWVCNEIADNFGIATDKLKIRDHQHLTYDIQGKNNANLPTIAHRFRQIKEKYKQRDIFLPQSNEGHAFVIASLPITGKHMRLFDIDPNANDPYNPLYSEITRLFVDKAKAFNLNRIAIVANGKMPIVRVSDEDFVQTKGELVHLGFQMHGCNGNYTSLWDSNRWVDSMQFVFFANCIDLNRNGYGKFVNHITRCLQSLLVELDTNNEQSTVTLRFYQHLSYTLPLTH